HRIRRWRIARGGRAARAGRGAVRARLAGDGGNDGGRLARPSRQVRRRRIHVRLGGGPRRGPGGVRGCQRPDAAPGGRAVNAPSVRPYLIALGATLLGQGLLSWLLDATANDSNQLPWRFANSDPRHALIHVVWGAA